MLTQERVPEITIVYPESDGKPMADMTRGHAPRDSIYRLRDHVSTLQFRWIVTIENGLEALFAKDPNVFVAGDLLWYPVQGHPEIRVAPDAMVVFGRPKGERGSYLQWLEDNIPPQVVFEILSPGNTVSEMLRKLRFYEKYGVQEYYIYDPDSGELTGWQRLDDELLEIENMRGWTSPRLGIRFEIENDRLKLIRPDGEPFATYLEIMAQRDAERERAEQERERAERAEARAQELAERLRALGIDPEHS